MRALLPSFFHVGWNPLSSLHWPMLNPLLDAVRHDRYRLLVLEGKQHSIDFMRWLVTDVRPNLPLRSFSLLFLLSFYEPACSSHIAGRDLSFLALRFVQVDALGSVQQLVLKSVCPVRLLFLPRASLPLDRKLTSLLSYFNSFMSTASTLHSYRDSTTSPCVFSLCRRVDELASRP